MALQKLAGGVIDGPNASPPGTLPQQRKVTHWSDPDGMCHTKLPLDPLAGAQVGAYSQAMDAQRYQQWRQPGDHSDDDRTFEQRRADVLFDRSPAPAARRCRRQR